MTTVHLAIQDITCLALLACSVCHAQLVSIATAVLAAIQAHVSHVQRSKDLSSPATVGSRLRDALSIATSGFMQNAERALHAKIAAQASTRRAAAAQHQKHTQSQAHARCAQLFQTTVQASSTTPAMASERTVAITLNVM